MTSSTKTQRASDLPEDEGMDMSKFFQVFTEYMALSDHYLSHAPHHIRHTLVNRIQNTELDILGHAVECQHHYRYRASALTALNKAHERLRYLWLLYYNRGFFGYNKGRKGEPERRPGTSEHRLTAISRLVNTLGRLIGVQLRHLSRA